MFPNGACLPFLNSIPSALGTMFCANKTHSTDQLFSKGTCPFLLALSPGPGSPPGGIGYSSLSMAVLPLGPGVARVHRTTRCCPSLQITLQHCKRCWLSRSNNTDNECFPGQYVLCILFFAFWYRLLITSIQLHNPPPSCCSVHSLHSASKTTALAESSPLSSASCRMWLQKSARP